MDAARFPIGQPANTTPQPLLDVDLPAPLMELARPAAASTMAADLVALTVPTGPERRSAARSGPPQQRAEPRIRLTGQVMGDATWRVSTGTQPLGWITCMLAQTTGPCFLVIEAVGSNPAAHMAAAAKVRQLRAGARCAIYADGIAVTRLSGEPVLQLLSPTIVPADVPDYTAGRRASEGVHA